MNTPPHASQSPRRYLWLVALVALPALGWLGILDRVSAAQLDGSITTAGLVYGTARGINALVSLLQGTEVNAFLLTFSIGEVLDPINDLIERFSQFILIALGSLALQKILLILVSDTIFNALLTLLALAAGIALLPGRSTGAHYLLRTFLVVAFLRFSLALVVLANSWVDKTFLQDADEQRHVAMEQFQGELRDIDTLSNTQAKAEAGIRKLDLDLALLEQERMQLRGDAAAVQQDIERAKLELNRLKAAAGGFCNVPIIVPPGCPENVQQANAALGALQTQESQIDTRLAVNRETAEALLEKLDCLKANQQGEPCGFWDRLPTGPSSAELREKLDEINSQLGDFTENAINLLVSLLLKTVVIPLVFLYLLLQVLRASWTRI
jgi:hypothetical protein